MRVVVSLTTVLVLFVGATAHAYNPPVDTAGPLTVRIEGPEVVEQIETPVAVKVLIENAGEQAVEGTVELGLVDRWRCEPSAPVKVRVGPKATTTLDFTVTAGKGTYSAHYPIHAYVRFKAEGQEFTAHPILILQTNLPREARSPAPIEWKPTRVPEDGRLAVWQLPVFRSVQQVFGKTPQTMPVGWQGSDSGSGGSLSVGDVALEGSRREILGIHPPWRGGRVGTAAVEFPLQLPKTTPLELVFANGMTPTGQGDGVTFRVRVLPLDAPDGEMGEVIFERHSAAKTWTEGKADLSAYAGKAVRLQFESHPGPKKNTGWDQSYWAEPTLVTGTPPEPPAFPPTSDESSRVLGTAKCADQEYVVRVWPGQRGLLDAVVGFGCGDRRLAFRGFEVRVLGARIDDARSAILLQNATEEKCENGYQVRHRFEGHAESFDLVGRLSVEQGVLRAKFHLENAPEPRPWHVVVLEDVAAGAWSEPVRAVYAGHGNVIRDPGSFRLNFDGHRMATSFVGIDFKPGLSLVQAVDLPPHNLSVDPDRQHCSMHAPGAVTMTFIPAPNAWEGARKHRTTNGLKAAGGVRRAAGRFVFDLWGGWKYAQSAENLQRAFRYGLTDSMVIWHNWQRWGYDYRLPNICPPNPKMGTVDEMRGLIAACRKADVPFALHDNYIDFYPDADGFSYEKSIAFRSPDTPVKAWLNEGRDARSYRYRSDRIEPYLQANLQRIEKELAPTGYFIDVWASAGPYSYWTSDGQFHSKVSSRDTWGRQFAWIRDLLGDDAPQISESGHDQLIGWLDGAQTNHLRVGPPVGEGRYRWAVWNWECSDAERTPWFDVAHHDRFILHGAGYSARYQGGLDARMHGIFSDDYVTTEVLTGHPGMVPVPFSRDVVRKYWLTGRVGRGLALRQIESVEFVGGDLHRQCVRWSGGAVVWVNRGQSDWKVEGTVLPQYGFLARIPTDGGTIESSISRRNGIIVETARFADELYVNGRAMVGGPLPIRVSVEGFKDQGDGRYDLSLRWEAEAPIPAGWSPFLHFCDKEGEIVFQAHHHGAPFKTEQRGTIDAKATGRMPAATKPGDQYQLRIGIYDPKTGRRLDLTGPGDGERRLRMGTVRVEGTEDEPGGLAWTPHRPEPDPYLDRQNSDEKPVDFGPVTTCGGVRLTRDGQTLVVTPLPAGDKEFTVAVRLDKLGWKLAEPTQVEALDEEGAVLSKSKVRRDGEAVLVDCEPGVFAYRLTGE